MAPVKTAVRRCRRRRGPRTSTSRGSSPELWFIDRDSDWGYGVYNGGWGAQGKHKTGEGGRDSNADPHGGADVVWEVTMKWESGSYSIQKWTVNGFELNAYSGQTTPSCPTTNSEYGFVPKIWTFGGSTVQIKDFSYVQSDDLDIVLAAGLQPG